MSIASGTAEARRNYVRQLSGHGNDIIQEGIMSTFSG
jgi:hypothetical protein